MKTENIAGYLLKSTGAAVEIERHGYSKLVIKLDAKSITFSQLITMIETCEGKGSCTISIVDGKFSIEIPLRKGAKLGSTRKERREMKANGCDTSKPVKYRAYYSDGKEHERKIENLCSEDDRWFDKAREEFLKEIENDESLIDLDELPQLSESLT